MCNHDENKSSTYLDVFGTVGEVYMCECGALIDIEAEKNYDNPTHPMTPQELIDLVERLVNEKIDEIRAKVNKAISST